jgi:tripartite-type tricarboxylate transporter receptor subunit TctC
MSRRSPFYPALIAVAAIHTGSAGAQTDSASYPRKAVRMIVPLAPGGGSDIVARIVAHGLSDQWGKPVIVDNRAGAGSTIGTAIAAKASSDGHTLLVTSSSLAISPALYPKLDFDVTRDLAPVTLIASQPSILAVHPSVQAASVADLVALARAQPLNYGSAGIGSATHLGTELLLHSAGMRVQHVPYRSAGLATGALLSGEVRMLLTNMASVVPHLPSGKLKAIGISSKKRSAAVPDLPTLDESGLPGFEYLTWYGMLVPAKTDGSLVQRLQLSTASVLATPAVAARLQAVGLQAHGSDPLEFAGYVKEELARWAHLVKSADIRSD